ncbi:hypothetical protein [Leptolyngbya sp. FACHB-261]|uniref:hypothetical protein n=1 Tax=Leptolyngbya sp. FACHB-261 TaxID=2692806 RepID=UPI0016852C85|nr:hypothetical protein [Leptolyngbya sp. FACHB-261]MBD2102462.1 hypothetical protein [Leptolyngbya sp. FACHB-261]
MAYTFEILGVSPILQFFYQQQTILQQPQRSGPEYLGAYRCTLDAFIESVETSLPVRGWELDKVVDTVVNFWIENSDNIQYWKRQLTDAGSENLLVARVANFKVLRAEFEFLIQHDT